MPRKRPLSGQGGGSKKKKKPNNPAPPPQGDKKGTANNDKEVKKESTSMERTISKMSEDGNGGMMSPESLVAGP